VPPRLLRAGAQVPIVWVFLAGAWSCAQPDLRPTIDSAGVRIRVSSGGDKPVPWHISMLATLEAGSENQAIDRHGLIATDARERIYVVDGPHAVVLAFAPNGVLLWKRGRAGGGPGEFRIPSFVRADSSSGVEVTDQGKRAIVRFDPDGDVLAEISFAAQGHPQSAIYVRGDTVVIHEMEPSAWVLRWKSGPNVNELLRSGITSVGTARLQCANGSMTINGGPKMFSANIVWAVHHGRIVAAKESEYSVSVFETARLIAIVRRQTPRVNARTKDVERLYPKGTWFGRRDCPVDGETLATQFGIEPVLPVIGGVHAAPDGSLWVERFTFPDEDTRVDVFEPDGSYLGTLVGIGKPAGFLSGGRFVALVRDEAADVFQARVYQTDPVAW
jgi:hypothetical protein